jgi:hypothetical protein
MRRANSSPALAHPTPPVPLAEGSRAACIDELLSVQRELDRL